ncbi:MAG: glutamine synthetase family protein [Ferrimicrobium sp.]
MSTRANQNAYVLHTVEERRIKFIQLWFTDVLGIPKSFQITPAELENALNEGMVFDGSAIDGFARTQESDVRALPDPTTFTILPTAGNVGRMFCDIVNLDGSPFEGCPRNVLRRSLERAHKLGVVFFASPEIEYFYFRDDTPGQPLQPLDRGSYFDLTLADIGSELRRESVFALEEVGISVEYSQHEDAPSQHEIDLRATDALSMADNVITARLLIEQIATSHTLCASFMPKPLEGVQGSGMHTHFSLFRGDDNLFYDASDPDGLSETARHFIAGVLTHAAEITAVTNQWVNSYKRLVYGYEAPIHIAWARNNRSALVRVPMATSATPDTFRIEYRALDPACNPYLAYSLILAAGLEGIESKRILPDENLLADPDGQGMAARTDLELPTSLDEAITRMEQSSLVRDTLGSHVTEWFIRNKREEWRRYTTHVSEFERRRYLRIV